MLSDSRLQKGANVSLKSIALSTRDTNWIEAFQYPMEDFANLVGIRVISPSGMGNLQATRIMDFFTQVSPDLPCLLRIDVDCFDEDNSQDVHPLREKSISNISPQLVDVVRRPGSELTRLPEFIMRINEQLEEVHIGMLSRDMVNFFPIPRRLYPFKIEPVR